jgi:predicted MFS family arabinose efflux permease
MQATVYNVGIAAGSLAGGIVLDTGAGGGTCPGPRSRWSPPHWPL